jgi:hypothetical protein
MVGRTGNAVEIFMVLDRKELGGICDVAGG